MCPHSELDSTADIHKAGRRVTAATGVEGKPAPPSSRPLSQQAASLTQYRLPVMSSPTALLSIVTCGLHRSFRPCSWHFSLQRIIALLINFSFLLVSLFLPECYPFNTL